MNQEQRLPSAAHLRRLPIEGDISASGRCDFGPEGLGSEMCRGHKTGTSPPPNFITLLFVDFWSLHNSQGVR